jgi:threonine dehydrogenase-like Zn-dependent dehydrogenase
MWMARMKAAVYRARSDIRVEERSLPEPPPGWVRIAVSSAGICGSDLHTFDSAFGDPAGMQPGHEMAGVVDAVGHGCSIDTGSHVAVEPLVACGDCGYCHAGKTNLCRTIAFIGFDHPGGLAEYVLAPEHALHELPPDLNPSAAALAEPMAVCVRGTHIAQIGRGDRVAIVGAGTIGLLSILTAREAGASEVFIAARHPHQQELALSLGADAAFGSSAQLIDEAGDDHIDVVLETVGGEADTLAESVTIARRGGRISVLGLFTGSVDLPGPAFFFKELTVAASNCYSRERGVGDFAQGTQLAAVHAERIEPIVTHTFTLDRVAEAFDVAGNKSTGAVKVHIRPSS